MHKGLAAAGSAVFFVLAPGLVAGVIPWWLSGWRIDEPLPYWAPLRVVGVVLIAVSVLVLAQAFARFVAEGAGTPAPIAPTARLVVGGLYRYVRNPMYLAVVAIIVGEALALGQLGLLLYAGVIALAFIGFVRGYEEPTLRKKFGPTYDAYRRAVPGWWPRRHPWEPASPEESSSGG